MSNPFSSPPSSPPATPSGAFGLTSREEIERVYSTIGVTLRLDDLTTANATTMMDEIVAAATETLASYTLRYYSTIRLANSDWARRRATIIGCYYLSMRRANGTQFGLEYARVMEELEKFLTPYPPFIPGIAVRTSSIPTISSYIVDDRNRTRKLRVSKEYSTKPYPGQYTYTTPFYQSP
jgi:hypothetical protein